MIPRILVPTSLSPASTEDRGTPRRTSTALDSRLLVPADMPTGPLQEKSAIPSHVPLDVLGKRLLVPRDLPVTPLERPAALANRFPPTALDVRIAVPPDARPPEPIIRRASPKQLTDLVDPDVFTTGEVHLLARPAKLGPEFWRASAAVTSVLFHIAMVGVLITLPRLIPRHQPSQEEVEMAHRSLGLVYVPPPPLSVVPLVPVPPSQPKIRIDPRVFQQVAPPDVEASPNPGPLESHSAERSTPDASSAPRGGGEKQQVEPPRQIAKLEPPQKTPPESLSGLRLEPRSPGRLLEDSVRGALRKGVGGGSGEFGDALPPTGPGGSGGTGRGFVGGTVQILTPTEGVDFTTYVARMLASVRRNWYAVIPESARMGERGIVILDFSVQRNGNVPWGQPDMARSSGREPLDRAAMSAIRASSPFEPLPAAFSGPEVRFRFIFLYNTRLGEE
jgi:TonB family protein